MSETAAPAEERDVMAEPWCCLTCSSRFAFGRLRFGPGALRCPVCRSDDTAAAGGQVYVATEAQGFAPYEGWVH